MLYYECILGKFEITVNGNRIVFHDIETGAFTMVRVTANDNFVFKVNKRSISAAGGAAGLYDSFKHWIDNNICTSYLTRIIEIFCR